MIDLHCHTTASDGTLLPAELVARAKEAGADVIAVTDHDTIDGVAEAQGAGEVLGVRVLAGIELSAKHDGRNVHMLGYLVDASADFVARLETIQRDRVDRAVAIVERLNELGYAISMGDVEAHARGNVVARPHIARALVAAGYIERVRDAFTPGLIADGGKADVPKRALSPHEAVRLIRDAGGAPVIAHPGVGHHEGPVQAIPLELLAELAGVGLAGLEVEHPDHPPLVRDKLNAVARDLGLIATGGSDYHGDPGHVIGFCRTTPEALEALEAAAQ